MLQAINEKGELKNVVVDDNGAIKTSVGNVNVDENGAIEATVKNLKVDESGAIKVVVQGDIKQTSDREVVLQASVLTVGVEATEVSIGKKVTNIMVANYSETADITITAGETQLQIGANLALELPINLEVENLSITSTEADTKIQLVVKGVE